MVGAKESVTRLFRYVWHVYFSSFKDNNQHNINTSGRLYFIIHHTWLYQCMSCKNHDLLYTSAYIRYAHSSTSTWSLCSLKLRASHSWLLHSLGLWALCSHSRSLRYLGLRTSHLHQRSQKAWPSTIIIIKLKKNCPCGESNLHAEPLSVFMSNALTTRPLRQLCE